MDWINTLHLNISSGKTRNPDNDWLTAQEVITEHPYKQIRLVKGESIKSEGTTNGTRR